MLKLDGIGEVIDTTKTVQRIKYYVQPQNSSKTDVIPIAQPLFTRVLSSVSLNHLGKQLLEAAANGKVETLKNLFKRGAPFTADWLGTSPLHLAAQNNHLEVVEVLLNAGISRDARTKVDRTPLHMAAYEGHLQIVDILVKYGSDIDCKDLLGMTPLHWAVQNSHIDIVEYLLTNGADANEPNKFGLTPHMIAQQTQRPDIERLLDLAEAADASSAEAAQNLLIQLEAVPSGEEAVPVGVEMQQQMPEGGDDENMELEDDVRESIIIPLGADMLEQLQSDTVVMDDTQNNDTGQIYDEIINLDSDSDSQHFTNETTSDQTFQEQDTQQSEKEEQQQQYQQTDNQQTNASYEDHSELTVPLSLLQDGILLQNESEENNVLNAAIDNGHSVVLTEAGKEILNCFKQTEQQQQSSLHMEKKIVAVTPEEFLAMANGTLSKNVIRVKTIPAKGQVKRIVMKKTKTGTPISIANGIKKIVNNQKTTISEIDNIKNQLVRARKTIEEYKIKLKKKEQEAEHYKMQLQLLMDPNS
ncbi:unnamed protein product [Acanthoscelides obtectus]|uniref:GA-binding protein subunit beta-1 n=1 Tax=Acanthoscelides obtectus TaxID=200917 RepID=A0A9P0LES4_ACAOB|nr:unnamed protein product [Acanthoscelides obtectus]CAK1634958.1 GA-binding protein subunit beta-1 [Acanthoscelides obtectus]